MKLASQARMEWSSGYIARAQADEAYSQKNYDEAKTRYQDALARFRAVEDLDVLKDEKTQLASDIAQAKRGEARAAIFASIYRAIDNGDLQRASDRVDEAASHLTGELERKALQDAGMLILDKYNSRLVKRVLDEIDELIDAGNDMEAEEKIEEALKTYSDTGKQFSQRLEGIRDRRLYVEALDRGRSNENGSGAELKTAIRAYQRAVESA